MKLFSLSLSLSLSLFVFFQVLAIIFDILDTILPLLGFPFVVLGCIYVYICFWGWAAKMKRKRKGEEER